MKVAALLGCVLLSITSNANAQIIQAVNRFANPSESEVKDVKAVANDNDANGANILTQASAQAVGSDNTQIALQAIDLWMSPRLRLYGRLTLPTKAEAVEKPAASAAASAATSTEIPKLSDNVVKQLVDPYGGVFNLSGGLFSYLGRRHDKASAGGGELKMYQLAERLKPQATPESVVDNKVKAELQPQHGAFIDVRGGFKFLDLPNAGGSSATVGDRKLAVFYTGIAGVKLIAHLYDAPPDGTPGDAAHLAGGLTLGVYVVGNYAADPSQSDVFKTLLKRGTTAVTGVIGINLPTTAALTFSFTPWTSDSRMGKAFVFGFNVLRPTKDAPPKPTASAPAPPEPAGFL